MPPLPPLYRLSRIVSAAERRSFIDDSRNVRYTLAEYTDPEGDVCHKGFETSPGCPPVVPHTATLQELRDLRQQW